MRQLILDSAEDVARVAAERVLQIAARAVEQRGRFKLVLAGGTTPTRCYERLARQQTDWSNWHIYFGDERCLPPQHPERNSRGAQEALLAQVPIPRNQIHTIAAELGPDEAARDYAEVVRRALPFDLVLLGMGEDGHTASLFPDQTHSDMSLALPIRNAPKPPPERVSLSAACLGNTAHLIYLITGKGKHPALQAWAAGNPIPAAQIVVLGESLRLVDREAATG